MFTLSDTHIQPEKHRAAAEADYALAQITAQVNTVPPTAMKLKRFCARVMVCCVIALSAAPVHAQAASDSREVAGVSLPKVVVVEGETLHLNGIGALTKFFFIKVYVVGLYLNESMTDARATIKSDETKRVVINMRRDVSRDKFVKALETSFTNNYGSQMPNLRTRLDRLENALPSLKKGDVLSFTYQPGAGTTMRCHSQSLVIPGKDFSDALFSIWLGEKPASNSLKRKLLGDK